jgi:RNA polymerase sigma factor (sigma-70 family)
MYIKPQFAFNEIEQEWYIGLMKAIEKFNPKLGFHFSTYATHRIYQKITIFMYNNNWLVRIPVNKHEEIIKLKYAFVKLKIKLERKPTNKELSQHLWISIKQIDKLKKIYFNDDYLEIIENPDYNNPDKLSNTTILKDDLPEVIDEIIIKDYRKQIDNILNNSCNEREKLLFTKYYLEEWNTLESIWKIVWITKERARQILKVTYWKVQNKMIK